MHEDNEREKVESLLEAQSSLVGFLGQDWVNNTLLIEKERQKAHFLFWLLLNPDAYMQKNYSRAPAQILNA